MSARHRFLRPLIAAAFVALAIAATARADEPPWVLEPTLPPAVPPIEADIDAVFAPPASDLQPQLDKLQSQVDQLLKGEAERKRKAAAIPSIKTAIQIEADAWVFSQDDENKAAVGDIENGAAFRRARVAFLGDHGPTQYRIEMDFALAGRPSFLDVWAGLKEVPYLGALRIGHFFEPFSLERYTANRFMTFLERSLIDSAFVPARNLGIISINHTEDEMAAWQFGAFCTNSDNFGDQVSDTGGLSGTARVTRLLWYDEPSDGRRLFHVGLGYSYRDTVNDVARFASQPESRLGAATPNVPPFVDTGNIAAAAYQLIGLEAAWVQGPLSVQSEYVFTPVNAAAGPNLLFQGGYIYASWFLTGEHRPYRRDTGVFDRVIPRHNFVPDCFDEEYGDRGCGAWELAARLSYLDLDDATVQGGRLTDLTLGVNVYFSPWMRAQFNYIHAFLDAPVFGRNGADLFGMRVDYDF